MATLDDAFFKDGSLTENGFNSAIRDVATLTNPSFFFDANKTNLTDTHQKKLLATMHALRKNFDNRDHIKVINLASDSLPEGFETNLTRIIGGNLEENKVVVAAIINNPKIVGSLSTSSRETTRPIQGRESQNATSNNNVRSEANRNPADTLINMLFGNDVPVNEPNNTESATIACNKTQSKPVGSRAMWSDDVTSVYASDPDRALQEARDELQRLNVQGRSEMEEDEDEDDTEDSFLTAATTQIYAKSRAMASLDPLDDKVVEHALTFSPSLAEKIQDFNANPNAQTRKRLVDHYEPLLVNHELKYFLNKTEDLHAYQDYPSKAMLDKMSVSDRATLERTLME